jgi:hypothetical protein
VGYRRTKSGLRQSVESVIAKYRSDGTDRGDLLSMLLAAQDPAVHLSSEVMFSEMKGLGCSFQSLTFARMPACGTWMLLCAPRGIFWGEVTEPPLDVVDPEEPVGVKCCSNQGAWSPSPDR